MPKKREKNLERELLLPGEGEVIGIIEQLMGYDKAMVRCSDGYTRLCRIPGRMRKRVWMRPGDIVLIGIWDFQPKKRGDILHKYSREEIKQLESKKLLDWIKEEEEI